MHSQRTTSRLLPQQERLYFIMSTSNILHTLVPTITDNNSHLLKTCTEKSNSLIDKICSQYYFGSILLIRCGIIMYPQCTSSSQNDTNTHIMFGYEIIRKISLPFCRVFSSRSEIGFKSACPWSLLLPHLSSTAQHSTAVSRASPSLGSAGHCMFTSSHSCFTSTCSIACNDLRL